MQERATRLDSWKAIAIYLNRDVRTVQRWEEREGLPVHRLRHDRLASIYAFTSELDAWVAARSLGPKPLVIEPDRSNANPDASPVGSARLERRDAAVLVATLARPGELADLRSPEELSQCLSTLNARVAACAHELDARVLSTFGDQTIVIFGLFRAEEDDTVRAARAALQIRDAADALGIGLKSAVAFGPLLVTDLLASTPKGAVVDEARRLAAAADEHGILVGPAVWRIVAPFFDGTPQPPVTHNGQSLAVRALGGEITGQTRFDAAARRGLTTYVGRQRERQRLVDAIDEVARRGGRVIHVVGEAGVGKSRLLVELRRAFSEHRLRFVVGRCGARARATAYLPFVEAFGQLFELGIPGANEQDVTEAISTLSQAIEPFIPQYLHLLGIRSDTQPVPTYLQGFELNVSFRDALVAAFTTAAIRQPTVLCLEDWHWADDGSIGVLHQLASTTGDVPLVVIVTSRQDGLRPEAVPAAIETLTLEPLTVEETGRLVRALLGSDGIADPFIEQVHTRTGGNPFFVEELCDSLREEGRAPTDLADVQIPSTVQAVIRTRIDRLEPSDREALRTAAVVGRECSREILRQLLPGVATLDESLRRLAGSRILQALRLGQDPIFRFKHALTHEVAYLSVPGFERKALHRRLASILQETAGTNIDQFADRLAFHFSRSDDWEPARRFALQAARRAFSLSQFTDTVELLEQARRYHARIESPNSFDVVLAEILLLEERAYDTLGERTQQERLLAHALEILRGAQRPDLLSEALVRLGELRTIQAHFDDAIALINEALTICRESADRRAERNAWRALAFTYWRRGSDQDALLCHEHALACDRAIDDATGLVMDTISMAAVFRAQGRTTEALATLSALEMTPDVSPVACSYLYQVTASVHATAADKERAQQSLEHAIRIQTTYGVPVHRAFSMLSLAQLRLDAGDVDAARMTFTQCVELCRQLRYAHGLSIALPGFADSLARSGDWEASARALEECLGLHARLHETEGLIDLHERLAWTRVQLGEWREARACAERAATAAIQLGATRRAAKTCERAALGLVHGGAPHEDVIAALDRALQLAEASGDSRQRGRLLNALGIAEFTTARYERARQAFERARAIFEEAGHNDGVVLMLNSLGATLRALGRRHEAIRQLEAALARLPAPDTHLLGAHAMALLGDIYSELRDHDIARDWFERSASVRRAIDDATGLAWMHQRLALLDIEAGLTASAREHLAHARSACGDRGPSSLHAALDRLATQLTPSHDGRRTNAEIHH